MERKFSFIVKEDILRSVFKTHKVVLVLGWAGTGKTTTCLNAAKGLWNIVYFNAAASPCPGIKDENVRPLCRADEIPAELEADSMLIVDDYDCATDEVAASVKKLLSGKGLKGRMVITSQARPKLDDGDLFIDAVVRMKENTAEILFTRLRDLPR